MKKIILKTAIVFSISIIGILNFNSLVNNGNISEFNLIDLFTQATAACENPNDRFSNSKTDLKWPMALQNKESYEKSKETNGFSGPTGCVCTSFVIKTDCAWTMDVNSFCNPSTTTGSGCD